MDAEREGLRFRIGAGAVKERDVVADAAAAVGGGPVPEDARIDCRKGAGFERTCMLVGLLSARGLPAYRE